MSDDASQVQTGAEQMPTATAEPTAVAAGADANPTNNGSPDQGSSSTTNTGAEQQPNAAAPSTPQPPAAQPQMDWEKQYRSVLPVYQKSQYELKRMREQYDGLDPAAAREALKFREEYQQRNQLKPWQKDHPEHQKFQQTVQTGRLIGSQIKAIQSNQNLSPEQKQAAIEAVQQGAGLSDADRQTLQAWQEDMQQFTQKFHSDPQGTIMEFATRAAQQVFQQMQTAQQAEAEVGTWFDKNPEVVQKYGQQMREVITAAERGETWQTAQMVAQLMAERDALRAQVAQEQAQVQTAAAQQQALRGRATGPTRRSPMTTPVEPDPVQEHVGKSVAASAAAFARMM